MMFTLDVDSYRMLPTGFGQVMPSMFIDKLIGSACSILKEESNCEEIKCQREDSRVIVVGDIHGQFSDLLFLFRTLGMPSESKSYVFNGNYVAKGAWSMGVLLVLLAWNVI